MFLKSIEVRGFKSFADKTELIFKKGITAVVGPNGSGKSNISDAVRWVLGEQSIKNLRGGKMEDVIFAGTVFRKPVGVCQVSLTLDNSSEELPIEYSDVTISRRLYRSGESEYYINNTHCRLKDIQELFMDTGIGKEGYSIIGQGKIDAILSGRAEERRNLLEEAAGIVKFKWRKEEAEKKLENTNQNLLRINDILGGYEERLEPLFIENEKAKVFLKCSEELKEKEICMILDSLDKIVIKQEKNNGENDRVEAQIQELIDEKEKHKDNSKLWNATLDDFEMKSEKHKAAYYESKAQSQEFTTEIALLKERISNLTEFISKTKLETLEVTEKLEISKSIKTEKELQFKELEIKQKELNIEIYQMEETISKITVSLSQKEEDIKKLKDEDIDFLRELSELRNNKIILENDTDMLNKKLEQMKTACEGYLNSIKINMNTKILLEEEIISINKKIEDCQLESNSNKIQITKLSSLLHVEETKLKELNIQHNKLDANHHMLANLEKQYEGYNRSVKTLMNDIIKGKIPKAMNQSFVLGDVIHVEKHLEIAIEIALGGAISDIITTNEEIAKLLIRYLKDHNIGRATFLPLNIVKGRVLSDLNSSITTINGFMGVASKLLTYDATYSNAIEYVLGRTLIALDMESALLIAKQSKYTFKIVTLQGEVINPGGSLTGGSLSHKSMHIIGRKREIEELKLKTVELESEIEKLTELIHTNKDNLKALNDGCLNLKDQIHYETIENTKLHGKIAALDGESEKLKKAYDTSNEEIRYISISIEKNATSSLEQEEEIKHLLSVVEENEQKINKFEISLKLELENFQEIKDQFTNAKIQKAQIDEVVNGAKKEIERILEELNVLSLKCLKLKAEIADAEQNKERCEQDTSLNYNKMESIEVLLKELEDSFKNSEIERIKIKENLKLSAENFDRIMLLLNKFEEEKHKIQLLSAKLEMEKESLYTKMTEELELTYAEAIKYKKEDVNMDLLKKEILELKRQISTLGFVNVGAIEEYVQVKEKFNFMSLQREDLNYAKDELLQVIAEMTEKIKMIFNENFLILRTNFNETFKELFNGGSADLILGEGDALTANIEITVQPPGKKLQNINLMSGGEKVLSAIALLFAILKMKPTPFCILDEIEAALDDANVMRYANFLRKFSHNIQFIVITHRKGTMEVSDVLYGVTMEEKGISKIISVTLN